MQHSDFTPWGSTSSAEVLGASPRLMSLVHATRVFMRDFPYLNRLVDGQESNDRMVAWAVLDAINIYNITPPLIHTITPSSIPESLTTIIIRRAAASLLQSLSVLQSRNHVSFSDGGAAVSISDKFSTYLSIANVLASEADNRVTQYKTAMNIKQAWGGGVHTEYLYLHGYYGVW